METARLSAKGQIALPKNIRVARNWKAGTEFTIEETREGILLRPAPRVPEIKLEDVISGLRSGRKPPTAADIRKAISDKVKQRHDRGRY